MPDPFVVALGLRLAQLRIRHGLSQRQLAPLVGVSYPTIGRLERGEVLLGGATLVRIGEVLGIGSQGVCRVLEELRRRRQTRERALRLLVRNPGIADGLGELDETVVYGQAARAVLDEAVARMGRLQAAHPSGAALPTSTTHGGICGRDAAGRFAARAPSGPAGSHTPRELGRRGRRSG